MKRLAFLLTAFLAVAAGLHAGAKKQPPVSIRFYPEAGAEGGNFSEKVTLLKSGRQTYMASMPLFTESDVRSFYPFPATDGSGTMGAYLRLDDHGMRMYQQHTMSKRGTYVIVFFNGRHLVDLYVDKGTRDDIAVIPSGLTQTDIDYIDMAIPRYGHEDEKPLGRQKQPKTEAQ